MLILPVKASTDRKRAGSEHAGNIIIRTLVYTASIHTEGVGLRPQLIFNTFIIYAGVTRAYSATYNSTI